MNGPTWLQIIDDVTEATLENKAHWKGHVGGLYVLSTEDGSFVLTSPETHSWMLKAFKYYVPQYSFEVRDVEGTVLDSVGGPSIGENSAAALRAGMQPPNSDDLTADEQAAVQERLRLLHTVIGSASDRAKSVAEKILRGL